MATLGEYLFFVSTQVEVELENVKKGAKPKWKIMPEALKALLSSIFLFSNMVNIPPIHLLRFSFGWLILWRQLRYRVFLDIFLGNHLGSSLLKRIL